MALFAEFTIPPEALPGGETLAEMSETTVELERVVPTQESALPFFWVRGGDPDEFIARLETEPEIITVRTLEHIGDQALYRAEWNPAAEIIRGIERLDATVIEALGTSEAWHFQIRAQNRDDFYTFQEIFVEQDIPVHLERLCNLAEALDDGQYTLTSEQREALIVAFEAGYFDSPRPTSQEELGRKLGISQRAFSDRLRRGLYNLIASSLLPVSEDVDLE